MKRLLPVLILFVFAASATADDTKPLSIELLWELERIGAPAISPTGDHVVAPVTTYDTDSDESETRLWLFSADGDVQRALTAAGQSAGSPVFSPDGTKLAFTARRGSDEQGQVYVLPMDGPGEASRLTEVPTGVSNLRWVGSHVYFTSRVWPDKDWDEMAEKMKAEDESKVSAHEWSQMPYAFWDHWIDEARAVHVYRVPADGGEVEPVTLPTGRELTRAHQGTYSYDIHPDETWIAFNSDNPVGAPNPEMDLFLARIGSDEAVNITEANDASDTSPMFSPDGRKLAYLRLAIRGFYADTANVVLHDLEKGGHREITTDWDRSAAGLAWAPDASGLYGAIDDAGTRRVYFIGVNGERPRAVTGATSFANLAIADNGTLVATNESFVHPARLVRINSTTGDIARLDTLNDERLADVDLGTYEEVTFTGADGAEVQMWVHYPPGFDESKTYPLYLLIHGGPHSAITESFSYRWNAQTFASWGYVTAWHNFHGSSGFGQDFVDSINPDWLTRPYEDTIAAADWFAEQSWIDSDRMVAGGGSYGGYLASVLLAKDHPFNALVIHAPVYNMYSQMASDFAVHGERFGEFWERPEIYRDISPHYLAADFSTPALIIHGQRDYRVPVGQAFELFRTLQTQGIESRLIYYPDENHWILKPNNSIHWHHSVRDWVGRFAEPGAR